MKKIKIILLEWWQELHYATIDKLITREDKRLQNKRMSG